MGYKKNIRHFVRDLEFILNVNAKREKRKTKSGALMYVNNEATNSVMFVFIFFPFCNIDELLT